MKIPTLLGLAMLITAIALAAVIYHFSNKTTAPINNLNPKDISVVNISDTNITIIWQTDDLSIGQISYGSSVSNLDKTQNDSRDKLELKPHLTHFVTLTDLKPNTKYFYKIKSDKFLYPDIPLDFKTAQTLATTDTQITELIPKPIRGTILNTNLNPIDESLIFLKIKDAADLATFSSTSGNFILPLKDLRTSDLSSYYNLADKQAAKLLIKKGDLVSEIDILITQDDQILPPLTLGQNADLKNYIQKPPTKIVFRSEGSIKNKFDLNNDGKTNSLDLAILNEAINKKSQDLKYDFTSDNKVDQKDLDLLSQALK